MVFIWGNKGEASALGYIFASCPRCTVEGFLSVLETKRRFTVYFIPTFSYSNKVILACPTCQASWEICGKQAEEIRKSVMSQAEVSYHIRALKEEASKKVLEAGREERQSTPELKRPKESQQIEGSIVTVGLQGFTAAESRQIGELQQEIVSRLGEPAASISAEKGQSIMISALETRRNQYREAFLWHWLLASKYFEIEKYREALDSATLARCCTDDNDVRGLYAEASIFHTLGRVRREELERLDTDTDSRYEAPYASPAIVEACRKMGLTPQQARQRAVELFTLVLERGGSSLSESDRVLVTECLNAARHYTALFPSSTPGEASEGIATPSPSARTRQSYNPYYQKLIDEWWWGGKKKTSESAPKSKRVTPRKSPKKKSL